MLGHAAGGGTLSFKNGSTRFESPQIGYPLILPCNVDWESVAMLRRVAITDGKTRYIFDPFPELMPNISELKESEKQSYYQDV